MKDVGNAFADLRAREYPRERSGVYLNAASYGPLPLSACNAIHEFHLQRNQAALKDPDLESPQHQARSLAAKLINAHSDEIALVPNTNVGLNIAASAVWQKARDRLVLIQDREFPANVYPWLSLREQGMRVQKIDVDDHGFPQEDRLLERIRSGDVGAVSLAFVQFSSGFRANLKAIGEACRESGAIFVVDAIQGVGVVPFDVQECHADFVACGGQKWLCSPWGSGFVYVRREWTERFMLEYPGWLAYEATQDFTQLTEYDTDLLDTAMRFEVGSIAVQDFVGMNASVGLLLELGVSEIWKYVRALQQPVLDWANRNGVEVSSAADEDRRSAILCIRPDGADAAHTALMDAGIRCALREGAIRMSPHWYNTTDDVARLIEVLDKHQNR
ncbi:MAG TPA: aminotransferase class V-fold PLP-dependent enzyme [Longimicrobiales bacterium]|nr:aminotransferase class V-fold PLP-dependent enzyme [Longimicrobiales bacterium]